MLEDHTPAPTTIDEFVAELRRLRQEADNPSYAELAARIGRARESAGDPAGRARVARSTVYDVFRPGRRRLDLALVREVLQALDLPPDTIAFWTGVAQRAVPDPVEPDAPVRPSDSEPVDHPEPAPRAEGDEVPVTPVAPATPTPATAPEPTATPAAATRRSARALTLVIVGCVLGNLVGRALADLLDLPLHLDMVWTAVSAIMLGPWWGVLVAVSTNGLGTVLSGSASLPFVLVNVTGALVWGYGVRRFALGRTIPRFFVLNLLAGLACSVVATPILLLLFDGALGPQTDGISARLLALSHTTVVSVFVSNLLISLADKMVSGFVALAVLESRSAAPIRLGLSDGDTARQPPR